MGGKRECINGDNWETKSLKGQISVIELLGHDPKVKTANDGMEGLAIQNSEEEKLNIQSEKYKGYPSGSHRLVHDGDLGQEGNKADEQVLDPYKMIGSQCGPELKLGEGSIESIFDDHLGSGAENGRGPYGKHS
ncbi:hypothetical protein V6N13_084214 [Hibiscus sabdariffa]|uniref:Uncharacterized protein n=1 Tax=Hibiscus sabdariffa TaxID=183260 RepID=A0ABR2T0P4_9ROSI